MAGLNLPVGLASEGRLPEGPLQGALYARQLPVIDPAAH